MRKTSLMAAVIMLLSGCDTSVQKWDCAGGVLTVDLDDKTVGWEGYDEIGMISAINGGRVFIVDNRNNGGILDRDRGTLTKNTGSRTSPSTRPRWRSDFWTSDWR